MFKMPEPTYFTWTDFESKVHHHPYYSEAQVKQVRSDALEEAAKVCDGQVNNANQLGEAAKTRKESDIWSAVAQTAHASRIAIRKLKESI